MKVQHTSCGASLLPVEGINMSGAVVPHGWYRTIQTKDGTPDWECIALLSRLLHKHRRVWSERKQDYVRQAGFKGGVFHTSLGQLEGWLCIQPDQLRGTLLRLQNRGLITFVADDPELFTTVSVHLNTEKIAAITTGSSSTTSANRGPARPVPEAPSSECGTTSQAAPAAEEAGIEATNKSAQLLKDRELFYWWWRIQLEEFGWPHQASAADRPAVEKMLLNNRDYSASALLKLAAWAWHMPCHSAAPKGFDRLYYCRRSHRLPFFATYVEQIATEVAYRDRSAPRKVVAFIEHVTQKHRSEWLARRAVRILPTMRAAL